MKSKGMKIPHEMKKHALSDLQVQGANRQSGRSSRPPLAATYGGPGLPFSSQSSFQETETPQPWRGQQLQRM